MPTVESNLINEKIKSRFYQAFVKLLELGEIKGRQTYCNLYGIDKRNFYAQEKDMSLHRMQLYWLVPMVKEYNVSADWLLTGRGSMFSAERKPMSIYPRG